MRVGSSVYEAIADHYPRHRSGSVDGTAFEVFPEASASVLARRLRPSNESKQAFRRAVLDAAGVDTAPLATIDQVDAALGALTGVYALAGTSTAVGDPMKGRCCCPWASCRSHRSTGRPRVAAAPPAGTGRALPTERRQLATPPRRAGAAAAVGPRCVDGSCPATTPS
jgi:hypothetical protein